MAGLDARLVRLSSSTEPRSSLSGLLGLLDNGNAWHSAILYHNAAQLHISRKAFRECRQNQSSSNLFWLFGRCSRSRMTPLSSTDHPGAPADAPSSSTALFSVVLTHTFNSLSSFDSSSAALGAALFMRSALRVNSLPHCGSTRLHCTPQQHGYLLKRPFDAGATVQSLCVCVAQQTPRASHHDSLSLSKLSLIPILLECSVAECCIVSCCSVSPTASRGPRERQRVRVPEWQLRCHRGVCSTDHVVYAVTSHACCGWCEFLSCPVPWGYSVYFQHSALMVPWSPSSSRRWCTSTIGTVVGWTPWIS